MTCYTCDTVGVINITCNNNALDFDAQSVTITKGGDILTDVDQRPGKRTVSKLPATITFTVFPDCNERLCDVADICGKVVTVQMYNGRVFTLWDATRTGDVSFDGTGGGAVITLSGTRMTELVYPIN